MTDAKPHVGRSLEEVERRRRSLWIVAAILLLSVSVAVIITLASQGEALTTNVPLRYGFLVTSFAFLLYVFYQERVARRVTREYIGERERSAALEGRIENLTTLVRAARTVNSVLKPEEVFTVLLDAAMELTHARTGAVLLRIKDNLVVAVSAGPDAVERGTTIPMGDNGVSDVIRSGEALVKGVCPGPEEVVGLSTLHDTVGPTVLEPLMVAGRRVGVLALERLATDPPFSAGDVGTVTLFAEHAAHAVANANVYDRQRSAMEQMTKVAAQRSEFVATMVHDLRTPLVSITGYASVLVSRSEALAPSQKHEAAEGILAAAKRLATMTEDILRAAAVDAGAALSREQVDLAKLLSETRDLVQGVVAAREGEARPMQLTIDGTGVTVFGDPEALRHVFANLVENAVKYSPEGTPIELRMARAGTHLQVSVTDHGKGIPADELETIFERFEQTGSNKGGVGLGLYIVRNLVEAHGGRVWATSEGQGSTFTVALPVRSYREDEDPAAL